jgi:formylglycine-generating enzyme required for sulfatase activity
MRRYGLFAAFAATSLGGCSSGDKAQGSNKGSGSAAAVAPARLPADDMVTVPAGDYVTSVEAFRADGHGQCSQSTLEKVAELETSALWPSERSHVDTFSIDRTLVECGDFDACVSQGACTHETFECVNGHTRATIEAATQYCAWRKLRLPTVAEWQAAMRGRNGRRDVECANTVDLSRQAECAFKSEFGVVAFFGNDSRGEATRTVGCWHADGSFRQNAGLYPLSIFTLYKGLDHFTPVPPPLKGHGLRLHFRCVRDQAVVAP